MSRMQTRSRWCGGISPAALVFLGLLGSGCSDDSPVAILPSAVTVDSVAVDTTQSTLVRSFAVSLDAPAGVQIDYWTGSSARLRVVDEVQDRSHRLLVPRLRGHAVYQYEVRAIEPGALPGPEVTGSFQTENLPLSLISVSFDAQGRTTTGLTLLELRSAFNGFVFLDDAGQVVWYWETQGRPGGSTRRANGDFVFIESIEASRVIEVSPAGETMAEAPGPASAAHHDVVATPQNTLLFLNDEAATTVSDTTWVADRIYEWSPETGTVDLRWDLWDFYDPVADRALRSRTNDFAHANSLAVGSHGNIIVSFNFLNQIISVAPDFQSIEWKLGGIGSDFVQEPEAVFTGQHAASQLSEDRILCFDNRFESGNMDEWSRGLELQSNKMSGEAKVAWSFRPTPDNYARIISSARRLDSGNTLVHFGTSGPVAGADTGGPLETFEVTPGGEVVWKLSIGNAASIYRATPYTDIAGERVVE